MARVRAASRHDVDAIWRDFMRTLAALSLAFAGVVLACSSDGEAPPEPARPDGNADGLDGGSDAVKTPASEGGPSDAATPPPGPPPSALPVTFTRPDTGTPLTQQELEDATDKLVALLVDTRYFDVVDERIHGWPSSAPGFWYGTWWSGVTVTKTAGKVTYLHGAAGADNNGLRTAPYLEGACYAHLMWGKPLTARLVRRIARGYSSWALSMRRSTADTAATMLSRAQYPASVTSSEEGRDLFIDYSLNRPGTDNGATEYVHLANNPTFGDVFVKNKRSKDDMGQIFRSLVQAQACAPRLDAAGQADLAQTKSLYAAWSKDVEAAGYGIATLDKAANVFTPPVTETLAHYTLIDNVECPGALMIRLLGHGDPGSLGCGSGISNTEKLVGSQLGNGTKQILRTHHEAAVNVALLTQQTAPALSLLGGLAERVVSDVASASLPAPPADVNPTDIVSLVLHAANTGVPLTSTEVRFVHAHLASAWTTYRSPAAASTYRVFDAATPDGTYPYDPSGSGMSYSDIGLLIGSCASPYRNPTGRPLLDCKRLLAALP